MYDNESLIVNDVTHFYKKTKSINNFSLRVKKGEVVSLLGPSGCGKTTLLRLIAGFDDPVSGEIIIGENIVYGSNYISTEKRGVGMLFQDIALFPHLTVGKNIGFAIENNKNRNEVIINLLKKVGLENFVNRYPDTLSGGQQQRVALARALARNPEVMLLDEPFASLDTWSKYDIGEGLIKILKSSNTSTLIVTHDPQEAMRLSDRVLIMLNGTIVDEGAPDKLYKSSKHSFAARLLGPIMDFKEQEKQLIFKGIFGEKFSENVIKGNNFELLIRPDAFSIPNENEKGFELEIISYKNLGLLTELEINVSGSPLNIKILVYTNIFNMLINVKKLLFDKEWAFVFPKS